MDDESKIPELTLNPGGAATQAAAAEKIPTLTLGQNEPAKQEPEKAEVPVEKLDINSLAPAEQAAVREFSKKIDVTDSTQILNYGSNAQKNISDFSAQALEKVRTKDLGEAGQMLADLVGQLHGLDYNPEESKGLKGLFKRTSKSISDLKAKYDKAEVNVDKISQMLDQHWVTLNKDIVTMDKMYEMNQAYFKELSMYIIAGKLRLEELRTTELPRIQQKANESNLPEDAQAANDFANMLGRFEKRLYDLELTRTISIQMSPQIRMIQNNDSLMAEKIQTAIVNTIPLWKSQMVLAMSMYHSQQAMEASHNVSEVTNQLLEEKCSGPAHGQHIRREGIRARRRGY